MRALVVTHGDLARELIDSAHTVFASEAPIESLSNRDSSVEDLRSDIASWLERDEEPALVLVDVGGGSCATAALLAVRDRRDTWVLGGVNLAMVLTFLSSHTDPPADLVSKVLDRALNSVGVLGPNSTTGS